MCAVGVVQRACAVRQCGSAAVRVGVRFLRWSIRPRVGHTWLALTLEPLAPPEDVLYVLRHDALHIRKVIIHLAQVALGARVNVQLLRFLDIRVCGGVDKAGWSFMGPAAPRMRPRVRHCSAPNLMKAYGREAASTSSRYLRLNSFCNSSKYMNASLRARGASQNTCAKEGCPKPRDGRHATRARRTSLGTLFP